ncbi:MAG: hypothetical protein NTW20_16615 [Rhodobacterales bacterium]|nr:hypothetical protein [Rhodobacterales bacterium]
MTMPLRHALLAVLALAPAPTLAASFDCTIVQQCGGGTCEAFEGGPLVVKEAGDVWQVSLAGQAWEGYSTTTVEAGGEVSIVLPPQNGISGLISIYPSGEVSFTVHAYGDAAVAITGSGTCAGEGG